VAASEPLAEPVPQHAAQAAPDRPEEPPVQKKRGFWSRMFGVGKTADRK